MLDNHPTQELVKKVGAEACSSIVEWLRCMLANVRTEQDAAVSAEDMLRLQGVARKLKCYMADIEKVIDAKRSPPSV